MTVSIRKAKFTDWQLLNNLYSRLPSYIEHNERDWQKNFLCEPYSWHISSSNAYICTYGGKIVATQGDVETVKQLILNYMNENKNIILLFYIQNADLQTMNYIMNS